MQLLQKLDVLDEATPCCLLRERERERASEEPSKVITEVSMNDSNEHASLSPPNNHASCAI